MNSPSDDVVSGRRDTAQDIIIGWKIKESPRFNNLPVLHAKDPGVSIAVFAAVARGRTTFPVREHSRSRTLKRELAWPGHPGKFR
jgi:hypothetical protein